MGGMHAVHTHKCCVGACLPPRWGMALADKEAGKGGERRNPSTRIQMGGRAGGGVEATEKGTYNLILGELLDEEKDHVRRAVMCVWRWACVNACRRGRGQVRGEGELT